MEYTRSELLNLFAEVRQVALTESLGQVTCDGSHDPLYDGTCYICGAVV